MSADRSISTSAKLWQPNVSFGRFVRPSGAGIHVATIPTGSVACGDFTRWYESLLLLLADSSIWTRVP
jgi:hypothetical protein